MSVKLTPRVIQFLASQEGLCLEAYKDGGGVWTWALGVTDASGHDVSHRYVDNPQPLQDCVTASVRLIKDKYLPVVAAAFGALELTEEQTAAALSFQWNTGAIRKAQWVVDYRMGHNDLSRRMLTGNYLNGGQLLGRRKAEARLFFDRKWPDNMLCPIYPVSKTTHSPVFSKGVRQDILPEITKALG